MAFLEITDGTGSGSRAKVNPNNRLESFSIIEHRMADISNRTGQAFLLTTDFISLTNISTFNTLMYIKNTNPNIKIYIDKIRICGTGTSMGYVKTKFYKNATSGTIISDANLGMVEPSNLGSTQDFDGLCYTASGDGKTITDGTQISQFTVHLPGHTVQEYNGSLILTGSTSLAIQVLPSYASEVCVEIQCWIENI